ncbi:MAG: glycoside hydrolase family 18 protein [Lewinellaceae bacterium]|nr:glycoside hydrolase family 18 protein [Lewinellaceae bacterium]
MKSSIFLILSFLLLGCIATRQKSAQLQTAGPSYVIIGYVHGNRQLLDGDRIPAERLTHINYAFANVVDGEIVEGSPEDAANLETLVGLKKRNPNLKILVSAGGWGWSGGFSDAVLTEQSRGVFANSAIDMVVRHQLDGIDLDWEYPGLPGAGNPHRPEDKENFTAALQLIREKLDSLGQGQKHYLLTIATAANQQYLDHTEMGKAQLYLDFVNIMTYDFHGGWSSITGHHANLQASVFDTSAYARSAANAVAEHLSAGIPIEKLVLGVPFYGRWWAGVNPQDNGLYQAASGKAGSFRYYQLADSLIDRNGYKRYWDSTALAPYLWNEDTRTFVTYEDTISLGYKTDYVKAKGMGGIMFWEYKQDDGTLVDFLHQQLAGKKE